MTPSFNQSRFLEETIRSVLLQGYPDLEYIIIDGGSTDGSIALIKRYEPWLRYWVSERDTGQSHAINKGFGKASGTIYAWLNSDDFYMRGILREVATEIAKPRGLVIGDIVYVDEGSRMGPTTRTNLNPGGPRRSVLRNYPIDNLKHSQAAMFWTRAVHLATQPLGEHLHYVMDFDFLLRAVAEGTQPRLVHSLWSAFRRHPGSKGCSRSARCNLEAARLFWHLAQKQEFRAWGCLRLARLHLGYYWKKRAMSSAERSDYLCALLWVAGTIFVRPTLGSIRSTAVGFLRAANGIRATDDARWPVKRRPN